MRGAVRPGRRLPDEFGHVGRGESVNQTIAEQGENTTKCGAVLNARALADVDPARLPAFRNRTKGRSRDRLGEDGEVRQSEGSKFTAYPGLAREGVGLPLETAAITHC